MKTSRVKEVNDVKEWGEGDRKTYYHNLTLDNGDRINIGKKSQLQVGTELHYEITDTSGQQEFAKAKSVNPDYQKNTGSGDLKGIKIGHAITNAVSLFIANGSVSGKDTKESIKEYAKLIYQISEELNNEL